MNILKIKNIEKKFIIEPGLIYNIDIENNSLFLKLVTSLLCEDSETFLYFEDLNEVEFYSKSIVLYDFFNIDLNSKKILNALYKYIYKNIMNISLNESIQKVNSEIIKILESISLDLNLKTEYVTEINITSLLNLYKFSFSFESESPLEKLITYIKANLEVLNLTFIITLNTLPLFSDLEIDTLKKELDFLGLSLININLKAKTSPKLIDQTTIDYDLCEF